MIPIQDALCNKTLFAVSCDDIINQCTLLDDLFLPYICVT